MKRIASVLISLLLLFCFCGCNNSAHPLNSDASKPSTENDVLLSVLHSEKPFVTQKNTTVYLKDYKPFCQFPGETDYYEKEDVFVPREYALVDLDKDGENELVIAESPDADTYLILHKSGETVYGYSLYIRWFNLLKADGTFISSGGAFNHVYNTIAFDKNTYHFSAVATFDYVPDTEKVSSNQYGYETDDEQSVFEISGKPVSLEEIEQFIAEWNKRPAVDWIPFS